MSRVLIGGSIFDPEIFDPIIFDAQGYWEDSATELYIDVSPDNPTYRIPRTGPEVSPPSG